MIALRLALSCSSAPPPPAEPAAPSAAEAAGAVARFDTELRALWLEAGEANWAYETNINDATEAVASAADAKVASWMTTTIPEAARFDATPDKDPAVARQLARLKLAQTIPSPKDPAALAELAGLKTELAGLYGKGKYCQGENCRNLEELSRTLATSRDPDALLDAWVGWRTVSPPMRAPYTRMVQLANEGAREIGFSDVGSMWRSGYDMPPDAFTAETDRLWNQVRPLYEQLHCHVRAKLHERYPTQAPATGTIPAHLLGNMWSQSWENVYPLVEPYPHQPDIEVDSVLAKQGWDHLRMVKTGEAFFTSMGIDPMPATFWERSLFVRPTDRDVECHASAWDVGNRDDLRIKMCIQPTMDDLQTIHHELGHLVYDHAYVRQPVLFQDGAHDGFHEAIGDAVALSITPSYLQSLGLLEGVAESQEYVINTQMQVALAKIAFLPFGRMIDQWRWDVFSGATPPDRYNAAWWDLALRYQGIASPVPRTEEHFDAGAKYHIPGNTPYMRYFLAHILQFQFHEAMCREAGHEGPLHTCSVAGSREAGARLSAMMQLGASQPWPDALEAMTGTRTMDAAPLMRYFEPLQAWLTEQNAGRACGWTP